jgi:hypothetical protein
MPGNSRNLERKEEEGHHDWPDVRLLASKRFRGLFLEPDYCSSFVGCQVLSGL